MRKRKTTTQMLSGLASNPVFSKITEKNLFREPCPHSGVTQIFCPYFADLQHSVFTLKPITDVAVV